MIVVLLDIIQDEHWCLTIYFCHDQRNPVKDIKKDILRGPPREARINGTRIYKIFLSGFIRGTMD